MVSIRLQQSIKLNLNNMTRRKKNQFKKTIESEPDAIRVGNLHTVPVLEHKIKPNYEKLIELLNFRTHSYSPAQDMFIAELQKELESKGGYTTLDDYGNLYVTKGITNLYPCVVAHTDINQHIVSSPTVQMNYPWIYGFDLEEGAQCGIGADDKVGVYFALEMFNHFDEIKLFFPKDEEVGLVGTYKANKEFFTDCSMLVQLDRNSYKNDLITYTNGITVCSDEFIMAAGGIMDKYNYAKNNGSCTDIGGLKKYDTVTCVAMNVSCGYINEHANDEVISMPHFENAINFGYELLLMGVNQKWEHIAAKEVYSTYTYGTYGTYSKLDFSYNKTRSSQLSEYLPPNASTYEVKTPTRENITLNLKDKDNDEFLLSLYPELIEQSFRETAFEHHVDGLDTADQEYIDQCLSDRICPCCYNNVKIDNRLLMYVDCEYCDSSFNYPTNVFESTR